MRNPSRDGSDVTQLRRRIRVALGKEPGDLLLCGGRVVNVFTGQVEVANVVVADGWIAGVGPYEWTARNTLPVPGQCILPGLVEAHMHVESTLLVPPELARLLAAHGTTTVVADPHEVGNVLGVPGIEMLIAASEDLPVDFFYMASSCVPCTAWEHAGATLRQADVERLLALPRILGLAEVMDFPAVLNADAALLAKLVAAQRRGAAVDGHAPHLTGQRLLAYAAAGVRSDHESTTVEEALQKAALGMLVQVREGSAEHNLDTLLPLLVEDRLGDWCLCSDDIHPDDLLARGHLEGVLRRLVAAGVPASRAIRHATLIPARHYGLQDRGAVAPGYRADLLVVDDPRAFRPLQVVKDGRIVAQEGRCLPFSPSKPFPAQNTVYLGPLSEQCFELRLASDTCPVIGLVPGQIVTHRESRTVRRQGGRWAFDPDQDILLVASVERHRASGSVGLGLVTGFGLRRGALASSVGHDSHNLIVVGADPRDMLACVRKLAETGGGWAVATDGEVRACLPLPVAGLMSTEPVETVCRGLDELHRVTRELGCGLAYPFGTLSFLALPVIPELRITDQGLFDVSAQEFVRL